MSTDIIFKTLLEIKELLQKQNNSSQISDKWISRSDVMSFFDYGDTQMAAFEKQHNLVTSKVGKRKFFARESLLQVLEKNANHASL